MPPRAMASSLTSSAGHGDPHQFLAMTSDLDIYRSANLLVKQHGEDAPIYAIMKVDKLLRPGV